MRLGRTADEAPKWQAEDHETDYSIIPGVITGERQPSRTLDLLDVGGKPYTVRDLEQFEFTADRPKQDESSFVRTPQLTARELWRRY